MNEREEEYGNELSEGGHALRTQSVVAEIQILHVKVLQAVHEHLTGFLRFIEG